MTRVTYDSMISKKDDFSQSGPMHLLNVNWTDAHHRRSVAASLVNGVNVLERDRRLKREGPKALASHWWEFFHFQLFRRLDDVDSSIFGAIYEFKPPKSLDESPRYVIAFRGTIRKGKSKVRDLKLDLRVLRNRLEETTCFGIAIQEIRSVVCAKVWLAGHSLGAAIALLAGKTMAKTGMFVQTFLFNPPFVSAPLEIIKNERMKHELRFARSMIKAVLATAVSVKKNQQVTGSIDPFTTLANWYPCLFVNPGDHLCSEYIGYFEHRKKMEEIGFGDIERLATQNSLLGHVVSAFGREWEPLHFIPSAYLTVNLTPAREAHGIHQWWRPDLQAQSKLHKYK